MFSPDGESVAFTRYDQTSRSVSAMVADKNGAGERVVISMKLGEMALDWSPHGAELLVSSSDPTNNEVALVAVDVKTTGTRSIVKRIWRQFGFATWLAGGRGVLLVASEASEPRQIWHVDPATGAVRKLTSDIAGYTSLSASADGSRVVSGVADSESAIWIGRPGEPAARWQHVEKGAGRNDGTSGVAWTHDGRLLFVARSQGQRAIWSMDRDGGNRRQISSGGDAWAPVLSPDGRTILFSSSRDGSPEDIWRMNIDGGEPRRLTTFAGMLGSATWAPDGRSIVVPGLRKDVPGFFIVPVDGGDPTLLTSELFGRPSISPDGKWLVAQSWDDQRRAVTTVVPYPEGRPRRLIPEVRIEGSGISWNPDGSLRYLRRDGANSNFWRVSLDGKNSSPLTPWETDVVSGVAWSRDGQLASVRSRTVNDVVYLTGLDAMLQR